MSGFDKWFETNYINNPNSALQSQERMALRNDLIQRVGFVPVPSQRPPQGPQVGGGPDFIQGDPNRKYTAGQPRLQGPQAGGDFTQGRLMGAPTDAPLLFGRPRPVPPISASNGLTPAQIAENIQNSLSPNMPQGQMATYNNLLQQGIQRSNTLNQDAASNFANMQAGAPIPQPAAPAKANPTMPIAGMGMQQPKATPVPRKFSTVNTPSARFG